MKKISVARAPVYGKINQRMASTSGRAPRDGAATKRAVTRGMEHCALLDVILATC